MSSSRLAAPRRAIRLGALLLIALLPGALKRPLYRLLFGYRIGRGVRIGVSLIDAQEVSLAEGVRIGHLNAIVRVGRLEMKTKARIETLNILRGGESIRLGAYAIVMRLNVLNAIPDHDCTTAPTSTLSIGDGAVVVSGHRIDFTDRVSFGRNVIVGGRNSSFWTHNRQQTASIEIGDFCYLGSEIRVAPGGRLAPECILALGSVLSGNIDTPRSLVAGVPAKAVRSLRDEDLVLVHRKTRGDMPDGYYERSPTTEGGMA